MLASLAFTYLFLSEVRQSGQVTYSGPHNSQVSGFEHSLPSATVNASHLYAVLDKSVGPRGAVSVV